MSKLIEINTHDFFGGISDDARHGNGNSFIISKHFDIFSTPSKLTPYRSLETDTNDGSTSTGMKQYLIKDFIYPTGSQKLYGLGQSATGLAEVFLKSDATTGTWSIPSSSTGNGAVQNGCFFEFKDYAWGFQGTNQIFKWGLLSGTPSITNSVSTVASTITSVANGLIAADGNGYMAYNNVVVRIATDTTTITDSAKTVPTNYKITSLSNYGSYLAIGCSPVSSYNGQSKVFLWNLSSTLFAETVDWGEGELRVIETIEGMLVGITDRYLNSSSGAGKGSLIVQGYQNGAAQVLKEVFTQTLVGKTIPTSKAVKNNRLFFVAKIMTNAAGTEYNEGVWSFGRKNSKYPYALTLDIIDENVSSSGIQGFGTAANYFFITHSGDGSIDKTDDIANYNFTSIYESQIFDFGEMETDKQLLSVDISFIKLTSGQTVTLKYKVDDASSWTTIGSDSTVGDTAHTFLNIESSGIDFASGKEYKFRIDSAGGAEITGFKVKALVLDAP